MTILTEPEFLTRAASHGVVPDRRYAEPRCLVYEPCRGDRRFWQRPRGADEVRPFLAHVLAGLDGWAFCDLWPRGGRWFNPDPPHSRLDENRALVRYGGPVPDGFRGALRFPPAESGHLLNLIDDRSRTAWNVADDLFVVPDHATQFLHLDHHGVIHVRCADAERMDGFIRHMDAGGVALPEKLPDETFKPPSWMK